MTKSALQLLIIIGNCQALFQSLWRKNIRLVFRKSEYDWHVYKCLQNVYILERIIQRKMASIWVKSIVTFNEQYPDGKVFQNTCKACLFS